MKKLNKPTRLENFFAYFECFFKNRFTRFAVILIMLPILHIILMPFLKYEAQIKITAYLVSGFLILYGLLILRLTRFGLPSYLMYKRAFEHIIRYRQTVITGSYCTDVGCEVAVKRFKKKYPEEFEKICEESERRFLKEFFEVKDSTSVSFQINGE